MKTRPSVVLSGIWLLVVILATLLAPLLATHDPIQPVGPALSIPQPPQWLGTDGLGRDVWSRLVWGGRISLGAALASACLTILIGGAAALVAASFRGWLEGFILWAANSALAIPGLLLALILVAGMGRGLPAVILAVGLGGAPGFARMARTALLQVGESGYVAAAAALGAGRGRIALRHLLPNARGTLLSLATIHFAWAFMGTTTLSFLGLAGDPSLPEWGAMLNAGRTTLIEAPWLALIPGAVISLTILAVHSLGSYLAARGITEEAKLT